MIDVFTKVVLAGACLFTFAWVILTQWRTIKRLSDAYLRLTHFQRVVAALAVIICTVYAQKPSTNDVEGVSGTNTNEELRVESAELTMGQILMSSTLHSSFLTLNSDSAAPYRLESVSTNSDISYAKPADGAIRGTWHLTGAYEDVQTVALEGFSFPLGSDLCTSLWAYTWGKVRPQLKNASNEIAAVGAPMSAIPDVSRFWIAATTNDSYLLTWENFAAGRINGEAVSSPLQNGIAPSLTSGEDAASPLLSAQIELFRNGDFITRSNDVESVWRRRMPCDLDEDGWIDDIDPTPEEFDENGFGPHQSLPVGDNTNYYYWVDLVVDQANARITFEGEGHSALPDPDFIARAGETNRVMLLIGKTYVVRCDLPVRCVGKEDDEVCVWNEGRSLGILWPIYLEFVPSEPLLLLAGPLFGAPSNGGGDTGISVHPERAGGGDFSWPDNFCCYTTAADGSPIFCCDGNCGCGGCYTGDITYRIGEHELSYGGWSCGCSHEPDDPHDDDPPEDPPSGPSVSATFSQGAIIFEDAYENSPGVFVPRRSTEVEAEFYVYGGTNGGSYAFTLTDGGRLQRLGGSYVPRNGTVKAGEDFHIKVRYDAVSASGSEGDVKAKVEFTENGSGRKLSNEAELTAVKVEIRVRVEAPANTSINRHILGVCERIVPIVTPSVGSWSASSGASADTQEGSLLDCPVHSASNPFSFEYGNISYVPQISVVEPNVVEGIEEDYLRYGLFAGTAGGIGLQMKFRIFPLTVSFSNVQIEEIPSSIGLQYGYFDHPYFDNERYHSTLAGAGRWAGVDGNNVVMGVDTAAIEYALPRMTPGGQTTDNPIYGWSAGSNVWSVPFGWRSASASGGGSHYGAFAAGETQEFVIDVFGNVEVRKLRHISRREITNDVYLDGVLQ